MKSCHHCGDPKEDVPEKLYLAFSKCCHTNFGDEAVYDEFEKLSTEFLGVTDKEDSLQHSRLVVILTKMLIEVESDWYKEKEDE